MKLFYTKIIGLLFSIFLFACEGKTEKSWTVTDFSIPHQFRVKVPKNKTVTNANIYLTGDFSDTIYLSKVKNDSTMKYTQKILPNKIMSDFYGGVFDFYLAPSNAKGKLKIMIEINHY